MEKSRLAGLPALSGGTPDQDLRAEEIRWWICEPWLVWFRGDPGSLEECLVERFLIEMRGRDHTLYWLARERYQACDLLAELRALTRNSGEGVLLMTHDETRPDPEEERLRQEFHVRLGPIPLSPSGGGDVIHEIPLASIRPNPLNPREEMDNQKLAELADSIRQHGILQPIIVHYDGGVQTPFLLLAGERRWRAASMAGLATIPAVIRTGRDAGQELSLLLIENLQRVDLNPIEQARAFAQLQGLGSRQREIAQAIGVSQPAIAHALSLLKLPPIVQEYVRAGVLSAAHGRALARFASQPKLAEAIAALAIAHDTTSKELEQELPFAAELRARGLISEPMRTKGEEGR